MSPFPSTQYVVFVQMLEKDFLTQEPIKQWYPLRDYHTFYIGKIEKVLVRDEEYLSPGTSLPE